MNFNFPNTDPPTHLRRIPSHEQLASDQAVLPQGLVASAVWPQMELQIHQERLRAAASATERLASRCTEAERDNEILLRRLDELSLALQSRAASASGVHRGVTAEAPPSGSAVGIGGSCVVWKSSERRALSERRPPQEPRSVSPDFSFADTAPSLSVEAAETVHFGSPSFWKNATVAGQSATVSPQTWAKGTPV